MRIFITGATGFIGSAVVRELVDVGHQVLGLARSEQAATKLAAMRAEVHRGELSDLESLAAGAASCDGVIHLGFIHDSGDFAAAAAIDRQAIAALGDALAGSDKVFVGTSGTMLLTSGHIGTEDDPADPQSAASFRVASEQAVLALNDRRIRACVVRPAPSVHGEGDQGFMAMLVRFAQQKGVSAYIGDGRNRWPAVQRLDAARLFRLAVESGMAGARYHAVDDEGIPFRSIAEAIGRRLDVPTHSMSVNEAAEHFAALQFVVAADNPASSALTRKRLGWVPTHPGLLAELDGATYFNT